MVRGASERYSRRTPSNVIVTIEMVRHKEGKAHPVLTRDSNPNSAVRYTSRRFRDRCGSKEKTHEMVDGIYADVDGSLCGGRC